MRTHVTDADNAMFIPSVELVGTREAKLMQLDGILSRLNAIRRTLAGGAPRPEAVGRPRGGDRGALGWWAAGVVLAMLFVLLTAGAWANASNADAPPARTVAVVHETY